MRSRRRRSNVALDTDLHPLLHLWTLRILVPLSGYRGVVHQSCIANDDVATAVGLGHWVEPQDLDYNAKLARTELRELHRQAEDADIPAQLPGYLSVNIQRLSDLVGLSETEARMLEFAVLIHHEQVFESAADTLGQLSSLRIYRVLSVVLGIPEPQIRDALCPNGLLARSGLLTLDRSSCGLLRTKLDLISSSFADLMVSDDADPISLLRDTVVPSTSAHLSIEDYAHIELSLAILRPYLKYALATKRPGVNVFLYGNPGTGKSQLAKVLAAEMDCALFEVASEQADGDAITGGRRLRAYRAAQTFFSGQRAILVFDEVEDVFNDGAIMFGERSTAQTRKGWINRALEENPVPTIWLSNSNSGMDPAFIRRFDMTFEVPIPPKQQRQRILQASCEGLLDGAALSRIAESEQLAPAVVTRAAAVVQSIQQELGGAAAAKALGHLINNTLEAQGLQRIQQHDPRHLPEVYDPEFIQADADLSQISAGIRAAGSARLCLFGPPGTGKTAYGRWLAEQMGRPLMVKRVSDLSSMWLGQTERNIAKAFSAAEQDGAVLMIDEVDSFLQDRRGAQRKWEISQVNEMLTQMEAFAGVFIASTNLMQGLDRAALRRFDLKVRFGFLSPNQSLGLLQRYCAHLGLPTATAEHGLRIQRLKGLTPGDFAAVLRQSRFRPVSHADELITALEAECAVKEVSRGGIGFLH